MIAQVSLRRCTPFNALSTRSPTALALHRSISLNSGIQQGLLAERRGRSPTRRPNGSERRSKGPQHEPDLNDLPERGPRRPKREQRSARSDFGASKFEKSDRPSFENRGRARPAYGASRSENPNRSQRPERSSFDTKGRSSRGGYASSTFVKDDPRFQSGKKPGKWERVALDAGAGRGEWRDVRAAHRPGTGPTKRYSKPSEIWNRFRPREHGDEQSVLDSFGDPIEAPSGREQRSAENAGRNKRLNRRAEKKESRRPSDKFNAELKDLEVASAVPELGDESIATTQRRAGSLQNPYRRSRREEQAYERRGEISYDQRDKPREARSAPPGRQSNLPDKVNSKDKDPYVHVHFDRKPNESLGRTREDKKLFNKRLAERSGRSDGRASRHTTEMREELDEIMEIDHEADESTRKLVHTTRESKQSYPRGVLRENRTSKVEAEDGEVPSRIRLTSATSELIFGRNSVMSVLRSKRRKLFKLYVHERLFPDTKGGEELYWELGRLASDAGVEVVEVADEWLPLFERTCLGKPHNGCILEASPIPTPLLASLGESSSDESGSFFTVIVDRSDSPSALRTKPSSAKVRSNNANGLHPLVIFCHNLTDTGNFGALLRSAYWFKVDGVAFPLRASAKPDAFTVKTSAGASEGVNLFSIRDPTAFLKDTRKAGWEIIAAMPPASKTHLGNLRARSEYTIPSADSRLADLRRRGPVLLILGGEEFGIPFSLAQMATGRVTISGDGENELGVDSLNVSVAGSLILSEFQRPLTVEAGADAASALENEAADTGAEQKGLSPIDQNEATQGHLGEEEIAPHGDKEVVGVTQSESSSGAEDAENAEDKTLVAASA